MTTSITHNNAAVFMLLVEKMILFVCSLSLRFRPFVIDNGGSFCLPGIKV